VGKQPGARSVVQEARLCMDDRDTRGSVEERRSEREDRDKAHIRRLLQ
jgi:hypothetical protein